MSDGYINSKNERVYLDENGKEYVLDERGNRRPPTVTGKTTTTISGFTLYDESQGHCGFCGSLTCRGRCFK